MLRGKKTFFFRKKFCFIKKYRIFAPEFITFISRKSNFMKLKTLLFGAVAGLLLTACGGGQSPEDTTKSFVQALADGECDKALEMSVDAAKESVQAQLDSGCDKYTLVINSVTCEEGTEDATKCKCIEKRDDGMETTYNYELKKVEGTWKIASYGKDAGGMDGLNLGGE
jgi:hypothetical protein